MPRKYEKELELAAPADRVWKAVAEAEGIQSWFAPEIKVEPGVGGSMWASWGPGMEGGSRIGAWEPGRHIQWVTERGEGREPNVVDFEIEAKSGERTILRLVNSGFGDDASFDAEIDSTTRGWETFLSLLKHSVEHSYRTCVNETVFRSFTAPRDQVWKQLQGSLPADRAVLHWDPVGYATYELPDSNRSTLSIFCENCGGSTALTIMGVMFDPSDELKAKVREESQRLANSMTA